MKYEKLDIIKMAKQRAMTYERLVGVFQTLPNDRFLDVTFSEEMNELLVLYQKLNQPNITQGTNMILQFLNKDNIVEPGKKLELMAIDRTKLLYAPHEGGLRPPYENQYLKERGKMSALFIELTKIYNQAGYDLEQSGDTPDYFCIQLDFMRVLCMKLTEEPKNIMTQLGQQQLFLEEHIGCWFEKYAKLSVPRAETKFYKGWILFLQGFLELEIDYLKSVNTID